MAEQRAAFPSRDSLLESAGCCGVIARVVVAGALVAALATLGLLLLTQPPDRWQGIADASAHPLTLISDLRDPQTVYAGTEQGYVLISRDGGQHWQETSQGLPVTTPMSALTLLPASGSVTQLLAGTSKGAYRSSDGGNTWHVAGPGMPSPAIVDAVSALPDGTLLAGTTAHGVYVLPAGSTTWMASSTGLPAAADIYAFLPLAQPGHMLAALISEGIYASRDGGMSWEESDQGLSGASGINVFSLLAVADQRRSGTGAILAGTSIGVYVSRDQGASWLPSSTGIGTTRVISLARDPVTPTVVIAGTDTGVYQSLDGGATWHAVGFGLPAGQHVGAVGVVHPAGGEQVLLASVDRLYRYPGHWLLTAQPWRMLGFGAVAVLALALVAFIRWQLRSLMMG